MHSLIKDEQTKIIVLVTLVILGSSLGNLSQTALNAMFSSIAYEFDISVGSGQWVTTLYMLVLGITVPLVTYLMKRFSLKTLSVGSLAILTAGALIDMVAGNFLVLIVGRVLQAVATGITLPMMMSIVMTSFPPEKRATVMGIAGIAMGFAPNIGPTIGGAMVECTGWRGFFVLLAILALIIVILLVLFVEPGDKEAEDARLDMFSFVLSALGFGLLLLGFSNASSYELTNALVWAPVVFGAAVIAWFVRRQHRVSHPLIDMRIFESRQYVQGFWAINALFACFMGITLIIPLYWENLCGGSAFEAGLALLPGTVAALIFNPLAGVLTDKIGIRPVAVVFSCCLLGGSVAMIFMDATTPLWLVMVLQGVRASGVSGLIGPLTTWSMAQLPPQLMTDGSSFGTVGRQACASVGTALMVSMLTFGPAVAGSVLAGYQAAFGISALFALIYFVAAIRYVR